MYHIVLIVVLAFFAHNAFEAVEYDVWHVNEVIRIGQTSIHIKDFFLFFDPPKYDHYGYPAKFDIQLYVYRLGFKTICFVFALGMFWLVQAFNIFLKEMPGREFVRLPYILLILVCLFGYELIDFILFYGQTDWRLQAIVVSAALSYVTFFIKK